MMNLPNPNFIERDAYKVEKEIIAQYEQLTGKTLHPGQPERLLAAVIAYRESLYREEVQSVAMQNLVRFATYPVLDYLGELVGCKRIDIQSAFTTLRFTLTQIKDFDVLIPKNTQLETIDGKFIFETTENLTITAGALTGDVLASAVVEGVSGNGYTEGQISVLVKPLAYVQSAVNISISSGGAGIEEDDSFRERIMLAPESFSVAGPEGAYIYWAKTAHQDIIDVAVTSPTPGVVNIYPLMKNGNPTQEILDLVYSVVSANDIRPLTDNVFVLSPTKIDFTISANVTLYSNADAARTENAINSVLNSYAEKQKKKFGQNIVPSQIVALINSVLGVYSVDPTEPNVIIDVNSSSWSNLTSIDVIITGVNNG